MKNLTLVPSAVPLSGSVVPLHHLIDQLTTGLLPLVTGKKSFIINDVDRAFNLQADEDVLAYILGNLLSGAVNGTENVCIRVEAVLHEHNVEILVRNNGAYYSNLINGFSQVVKAARQLGGDISVYNQPYQGTTLIFSIATESIAC